jgi:hypothetical protein
LVALFGRDDGRNYLSSAACKAARKLTRKLLEKQRVTPDRQAWILRLCIATTRTTYAHVIENKAETAYRRGDLFEKRRKLMEAWAVYSAAPKAGTIVAFRR